MLEEYQEEKACCSIGIEKLVNNKCIGYKRRKVAKEEKALKCDKLKEFITFQHYK
jgi:hypothetical protein